MSNKIVLVERECLTQEEGEFISNSALNILIEKFNVVSGRFNGETYLSFKQECKVVFLNIQTGLFNEIPMNDFEVRYPSIFNDLLIKNEEEYYYFTSSYGKAYRIPYSSFLNDMRDIHNQINIMDGVSDQEEKLSDEEFLKSDVFKDLLFQNIGESLSDNIDKIELIANCDEDQLFEKSLLRSSVRDFGTSVYANLGLKED